MKNGTEIFSLQGKTALITGATGYLGSAMARALAEAGAHVLVNSRSSERSASLVKDLKDAGLAAGMAVFDVTSQNDVETFLASIQGRALHILINNAYAGGAGSIENSASNAYLDSYDVTIVAAHNLLKAALPNLRHAVQEYGDASVINIASMYALVSPDQRIYDSAWSSNPPFYGAAKAALVQWTRYAACEFGHEGIRVNSISPGPFPAEAVQKTNPAFIAALEKKVPMGRIGQRDEIKGPALFLASSASSYVNGANLVVDGGWTCW
ncbi:MAG: SDR family NAD(P)-dependent oxidoreductase [Gallionellaceae bacterium]